MTYQPAKPTTSSQTVKQQSQSGSTTSTTSTPPVIQQSQSETGTTTSTTSTQSSTKDCPFGWISAATTPDGSCGHATINGNAIVDPIAWEHIAGATLGGIFTMVIGAMVMIPLGVDLCTTVAGCIAGGFLILGGVGAILGGGALVWSGVKFTEIYLNEIFVVEYDGDEAVK